MEMATNGLGQSLLTLVLRIFFTCLFWKKLFPLVFWLSDIIKIGKFSRQASFSYHWVQYLRLPVFVEILLYVIGYARFWDYNSE